MSSAKAAIASMNIFLINEDVAFEISKILEIPADVNDLSDIIDDGVKSIFQSRAVPGNDSLVPHFVYCGDQNENFENSRQIFVEKMMKFEISSALLTRLCMIRKNLVTKETIEKAYEGKLIAPNSLLRAVPDDTNVKYPVKYPDILAGSWQLDNDWENQKGSMNDDLEQFFMALQRGEINEECIVSFFTPMLTEEELKLIEDRDKNYLDTFLDHVLTGKSPDIFEMEMKLSKSESKYLHAICYRNTIPISTDIKHNHCLVLKRALHSPRATSCRNFLKKNRNATDH